MFALDYLRPIVCSDLIWTPTMASEESSSSAPKRLSAAYVLGYTGEVGKQLVKEAIKSKLFEKIVLIGRRHVDYEGELKKEEEEGRLEQRAVDFEKLEDYADSFKDIPVGFCCMGTTKAKAGSAEAFKKVDFDYVLKSAEVSKAHGCKTFHLVSSAGANKKSMMLYASTKGAIEEAVSNLSFERCLIYRPMLLLGDRTERRMGEKVFMFLAKPITYFHPTAVSIPYETVAKAMLYNTTVRTAPKEGPVTEVVDNKTMHRYAELLTGEQKGASGNGETDTTAVPAPGAVASGSEAAGVEAKAEVLGGEASAASAEDVPAS